jgi:hypothetical protein
MVPLDWLTSLILGTLLPLAAANVFWERRSLTCLTDARAALLRWAGLVFAPISTMVLAWQPTWGFMYLFDPLAHPAVTAALMGGSALAIVGLAALGFECSVRWIKARQRNRSLWLIFLTGAALLVLAATNAKRGLAVGSYDAWTQRRVTSFFRHPLLPVNLVVIPLIFGLYFRIFFRLGRAAHALPPAHPSPTPAAP